ncbi:hypothetical protein [Bacteroides fragilis]|uniref:hypothetical protein n=1 Tax=Bacteroides fragilis TaxID=817 RepID=UPI001C709AB5|nr:hypothetical protein [Bacteroides fragilis]MBW9280069.1 hypothetical protein [Bacteroides fragilis]
MDDIVKVLVIMAAFALPLIRQIKKNKTERSAQKPFIPIPDTEEPEVLKVTRKYQPLHPQPTSQKVEVKNNRKVSQKTETTPTNDPEFTIHSAEDTRKAIIWSEILNRKY